MVFGSSLPSSIKNTHTNNKKRHQSCMPSDKTFWVRAWFSEKTSQYTISHYFLSCYTLYTGNLLQFLSSFDKANSVNFFFCHFFPCFGIWPLGMCDTFSFVNHLLQRWQYITWHILKITFFLQITFVLEICRQHDKFLSN